MSDPIDIGHGVTLTPGYLEGRVVGVQYEHPRGNGAAGERCLGWVPFLSECPQGWTVESLDPLTLSPSLLCTACGHHGFIRQGRWVPA